MTYYTSRYLNIYPSRQNSWILFHGVTGCIDEVNKHLGENLKTSQLKKLPLITQNLNSHVLKFLERRGHITTQSADEEYLSFRRHVEKLHRQICEQRKLRGTLMLVPSYDCNLACGYCYQNPLRAKEGKNTALVMTPKQVDVIFNIVLKQLYPDVKRYSHIQIDLYGGEPFLKKNLPALERIFRYTKDYQIPVSAISNASSLETCLDFFGIEPGQVNSVQVSLDGDHLHHDQSRVTRHGEGTFDAIIANIHRLLDQGVIVKIRINTNKQNVDSLQLLWEYLEAQEITSHPNVRIYAQAIHNHYDQTNPELIFSRAELTRRLERIPAAFATPLNNQIARLRPVFEAVEGLPLHRTNFCMQNTPNSFLIDCRRDIYVCYEEAGNRQWAVGSFSEDGLVSLNDRYSMYQSRHVGRCDPCSKCSLALTCGGGCAVAARSIHEKAETIFTSHCDSHKELVAKAIQRLFEEKAKALQKNTQKEDRWSLEQPYL